MDLDQGGRQLAGLILDAAGRGQHDQVADLIAPLDADQLRSLVAVLAVQVDQTLPAAPTTGPATVCELAINAAAPMFGTTPEAILSAERSRPVSDARAVAMTAAREVGLSLPAIAEHFNKDHGSAIHAVRRTADRPRLADAAARVTEHVNDRYTAQLPRPEATVVSLHHDQPASTFEPDGPVEHAVVAAAEAFGTTPEVLLGADRTRTAADARAGAMTAARIRAQPADDRAALRARPHDRAPRHPPDREDPATARPGREDRRRAPRGAGRCQHRPGRRRRAHPRGRLPLSRRPGPGSRGSRRRRAPAAEGRPVKALIGLAAAAIAALTAGGITAALPGSPTGPDPAEGKATQVRVTAVVDGDTLRVEDLAGRPLGRVRLLGINAPEVAHPPAPAECYADHATDLLEDLAPVGSTVQLVADSGQPDRDRYDRLLRYVDHDDVDVAHELLAVVPHAATRPPRTWPGKTYSAAADDAQEADRGLWRTC